MDLNNKHVHHRVLTQVITISEAFTLSRLRSQTTECSTVTTRPISRFQGTFTSQKSGAIGRPLVSGLDLVAAVGVSHLYKSCHQAPPRMIPSLPVCSHRRHTAARLCLLPVNTHNKHVSQCSYTIFAYIPLTRCGHQRNPTFRAAVPSTGYACFVRSTYLCTMSDSLSCCTYLDACVGSISDGLQQFVISRVKGHGEGTVDDMT